MKTNCWCGRVRTANCINCSLPVCQEHIGTFDNEISTALYSDPITHRVTRRTLGQGRTLAEAAYHKGYWLASRESYTCPSCRNASGRQYSEEILRKATGWEKRGAFGVAVNAARLGILYEQVSLTCSEIVDAWLSTCTPPENVSVVETIRPAHSRRTITGRTKYSPERVRKLDFHGWVFAATALISIELTGPLSGITEARWCGTTTLRHDGALWINDVPQPKPCCADPVRLISAMAEKLCRAKGAEWQGMPHDAHGS